MDFGGEAGVPALLQISKAATQEFVDFVDRAVEQHIVIGHVEVAVVIDPARLDPHRRGDEGREKGGFGHLFGILAVKHAANVADSVERRQGSAAFSVIAGLDPAIHAAHPLVRPSRFRQPHFSMDHRVKPGGDEKCAALQPSNAAI